MKNVALVTGGSGGIGKELALEHAKAGGDLVIVARRPDALKAVAEVIESDYQVKVMAIAKDLSAPGAVRDVFDEVKAAGVQVKILVNNAGFGGQGLFWERPYGLDAEMIDLNVRALTELCRLYLPEFVARREGRIMNVSSVAGFFPGPLQAVYYASKAYVNFFSEALSSELEGTGVTVTILLPTATDSGFAGTAGLDKTDLFKGKLSDPAVVAKIGYEGMMAGKVKVYADVPWTDVIGSKVASLLPRRPLLRFVKKRQTIRR
jgi:short-subunit dehydrogenase